MLGLWDVCLSKNRALKKEDVHVVHHQMRLQSLQGQPGADCPQPLHQGQAVSDPSQHHPSLSSPSQNLEQLQDLIWSIFSQDILPSLESGCSATPPSYITPPLLVIKWNWTCSACPSWVLCWENLPVWINHILHSHSCLRAGAKCLCKA